MVSEDLKKKWGTIFMGDREASIEQLSAMQESLTREKRKKEQVDDYMERVRAKAVEKAREILGEAYSERQKVIEEAKAEASNLKKSLMLENAKIRAESEKMRKEAAEEQERARKILEEAEKKNETARGEGYEAGMNQAALELHSFRSELGQSVGALLLALEREKKNILNFWREDLAEVTRCAARAGTGLILSKEHDAVLRSLTFKALDLLENNSIVSIRVNPQDEENVTGMFEAARERFPELKQFVVTADQNIEAGGLVAESGSGRVDLQRENFREMVEGIITYLSVPETDDDIKEEAKIREIAEFETARIASLTPEVDKQVGGTNEGGRQELDDFSQLSVESEDSMPENEVIENSNIESISDIDLEQKTDDADDIINAEMKALEEELFPFDHDDDSKKISNSGSLSDGGFI